MKNIFGILLMMFVASEVEPQRRHSLTKRALSPEEEKAQRNERLQEHGVKRFVIDGKEVFAINEKNARRKASKIQATVA